MANNDQLAMIEEINEQMRVNLGREAKTYEIAEILDISLDRLSDLYTLKKLREKESVEQIESESTDIEKIIEGITDSDKLIDAEGVYISGGIYVEEEEIEPIGFRKTDIVQDEVMVKILRDEIMKMMVDLTEREAKVIIERFGLESGYPKTLSEIAKIYNATKENIRYIELNALRKLRHPKRSKELKGYLDADIEIREYN